MRTLLLIILAAVTGSVEFARAGDAAMSISIAVPVLEPGADRFVVAFDRTSHFPVIVTNTSDKPQRIVTESNSWGDHGLSFELTDKSGKKTLAQRVSMVYEKNLPHWWVLQPRESVVFDVCFADTAKWEGFPHPARYGDSEAVTLRAIFEYNPGVSAPLADGVWTGRVFSAPLRIVFYNRLIPPSG